MSSIAVKTTARTSKDPMNSGPLRPPKTGLVPKPHKNRKRPSPFRVKTGCVVALRENPEGNQLQVVSSSTGERTQVFPDDSLIPVWTNPISGRDEGLALVGKRLRCFLPKKLVQGKKKRIVEGEVTSIHDYTTRSNEKPWKIDLLVDKTLLSEFPFLVRTDEDVNMSQLPSDKARKYARFEETLRGSNKCTVQIRLMRPGSVDEKKALKWVIQKIVPKKLLQSIPPTLKSHSDEKEDTTKKVDPDENGTTQTMTKDTNGASQNGEVEHSKKRQKKDQNAIKYFGDKDDSDDQQILNWRWMSSRFHYAMLTSDRLRRTATRAQLFSTGFVGEVVKVETGVKESDSLATVTVCRMILPEQTSSYESSNCNRLEIYDDADNTPQDLFKIPIEELLVLSPKVLRQGDAIGDDHNNSGFTVSHFNCQWRYSIQNDVFVPLETVADLSSAISETSVCHRCRRRNASDLADCAQGNGALATEKGNFFCKKCTERMEYLYPIRTTKDKSKLCLMDICDCLACRIRRSNEASQPPFSANTEDLANDSSLETTFQMAVRTAESQQVVSNFGLPESILCWETVPAPSSKAQAHSKRLGPKQTERVLPPRREARHENDVDLEKGSTEPMKKARKEEWSRAEVHAGKSYAEKDNACARFLPYEAVQSLGKSQFQTQLTEKLDRPRNLRQHLVAVSSVADPERRTDRRAERAKQRRLLKGMAAFSNFDLDTLSSREPQLRFDRSGIHAWGVFADKDISSGDMIVEYRGEIIENAMAEKREKLYESAKIGSDYMFRIDGRYVCDATKVGNVARFLNASCDPNCYTKIITVDGQKRIVIYAKKDIAAGEELCYDYKFPLEYDPAKRIPCHCGASNCRGFMNWDQKYVVSEQHTSDPNSNGASSSFQKEDVT